jgi:hypothetical protein
MPDLEQIKQGQQVTTSILEGSAWRSAAIPSVGSQTRQKSSYF